MRKPLLLLHGAMGGKSDFTSLEPLLAETFDVHCIEFEGHGSRSPLQRPFRIEHFAENVLEYLDGQSLSCSDVFGYSMGGYVAAFLAARQGERLGRIYTLGTKFHWTPEIAVRQGRFLDPSFLREKAPQLIARFERTHVHDWERVSEQTRELLLHLGQTDPFGTALIEDIPNRVRIGLGDRDNMVSFEESIDVFRRLQQGELEVLPATPHPLHAVSIPMLVRRLNEFFQ